MSLKASIIVTNYNYGKYLARCLRSCFNQSMKRDQYEIILVDDCSTDNSIEVANEFKSQQNFIILKTKINSGVAAAANNGILKSAARYVVRIDSDDFVSNDFLKFLTFYLDDNLSAFCVSCDYHYVDDNEQKYKRVKYDETPISCGVMYRKDMLKKYGMYNSDFKHREEEELRARLGSLYKIENLGISLYRYRKHKSNKTLQKTHMKDFKDKLFKNFNVNTKKNLEDGLLDFPICIIPARLGSQRLEKKNIKIFFDKPMIYWAIDAAKNSRYIKQIYVSSESDEILNIAKGYGSEIIKRPDFLSNPEIYKMDVIIHAVNEIKKFRKPSIVVSLQANSPQIKSKDIDLSIEKLIEYNLNEVISVDSNLNQNGAIRTLRYNTVFEKNLSTYFGTIKTDIVDIHTQKDFDLAKIKFENDKK